MERDGRGKLVILLKKIIQSAWLGTIKLKEFFFHSMHL